MLTGRVIAARRHGEGEVESLRLLVDPGMAPFAVALAIVAGLLLLEVVAVMGGFSLMGEGTDAAPGIGADGPDVADGLDTGGPGEASDAGGAAAGVAGWLGFGEVPTLLWAAGMLTAFGCIGWLIQLGYLAATGALMPALLAAAVALVPAAGAGRWFARTLARIVPRSESSAIGRRSLGDRVGVVVQGTARRGLPAQARIRDGHGNLHYVRVEPVDDDAEIPPGTEVIVLRGRSSVLRAIPLADKGEGTT